MRRESQTLRESICAGASHGVIAWTAYAIVECWFASILPLILPGDHAYTPLHAGFTALLFVLYPAIGAILGGVSGLGVYVVARRTSSLHQESIAVWIQGITTSTVVVAFAVHLLVRYPLGVSVVSIVGVAVVPIVGLALSARWKSRFEWLQVLINPWTMTVLLVGLTWITLDLMWKTDSRALKGAATLSYAISVFLISGLAKRIGQGSHTRSSMSLRLQLRFKTLRVLPLIVIVFVGISAWANQVPGGVTTSYGAGSRGANRPNIILVTLDTVRSDHLSVYGYERDTTPNLRKLAEEATLYTRAVASGDMTLSSHASIFTGLYARQHRAHYDSPSYPGGRPLAESFTTLAEVLAENGYLTMGVVANYAYLGHGVGLDQGFQYYDQRIAIPLLGETQAYYLRQSIQNLLRGFLPQSAFDLTYRRAEDINREAFRLLEKVKENPQPFFLFVNYMDAHWPYIPPPPFDTKYPGKDVTFTTTRYNALEKSVLQLKHKVTDAERLHLVSQYDGAIAYLDFQIDNLIGRLRELGLFEDTLIIITSDHGEVFGERNLFEHGVSVYQDQVDIPLLVKYPKATRKRVVSEPVSLVDLMPTILDVLGIRLPDGVQGKSLLKLHPGNPRAVISESFPNGGLVHWHPRFLRIERAIFVGSLKFISSTAGKRELYDLSKDVNEKKNLYKAQNGIATKLERRLNEWLETVVTEESNAPSKLGAETVNRLKSLGYIK